MGEDELEQLIQQLLDHAQIRDVHLRYCRGIDRRDWNLVRSCYHPDAIDDHGAYVGGVEGFIAWGQELLVQFESTTHFTGNQLIEIEGDHAWAEHYALAYHRRPATENMPAADLVANVRYVDRMEKRAGEWRIANRVLVVDSDRVDPVSDVFIDRFTKHGRPDRDDISYLGRAAAPDLAPDGGGS